MNEIGVMKQIKKLKAWFIYKTHEITQQKNIIYLVQNDIKNTIEVIFS